MAKQGTEAGDYYNNLTLELIKQKYNDCNNRKAIDIPKEIVKLFSDLSSEITEEKIDSNRLEISEDNKIIKMKKDGNSDNQNKLIRIQNAYIDEYGDYKSNNNKFNPKYSLYVYKEDDNSNKRKKLQNYLLLRLEIPGNVVKLTARSTDPKKEKYRGIVIKGYKEKDKFGEQSKPEFKEIIDNRTYEEFSYFIELKRNLELNKKTAIGNTEIYKIKFDKKNKEKSVKDKDKQDKKESKEVEGEMIASGVYVMKFSLTENSFT
jgi:hypothetical protein